MRMAAERHSSDDLATPLREVTFCVIDVETTGGAPAAGGLTEVGAVKLRGGECVGTLQTLVNPGLAIPPPITVLTGITEAMVLPAPCIDAVLPCLLEFIGGSVIVGHNVRYDLGFLGAALVGHGQDPLKNQWVDTCGLARKLLRDEFPSCRLSDLAHGLRLAHRPTHRALEDALATGDLLHVLLERATGFGVLGLDDLLLLPSVVSHPQSAKLRLTTRVPRQPGVYLFRGAEDQVLLVGRARDLRGGVRAHFSGTGRGKNGQLLRATASFDTIVCPAESEAIALERHLIHEHRPRFNDLGRRRRGPGRSRRD